MGKGRKIRGHWLHCIGKGQYSLSSNPHAFGQVLWALPFHWAWAGGTRLAAQKSQSSRLRPCMIRWSWENFPEEAILELGLRG